MNNEVQVFDKDGVRHKNLEKFFNSLLQRDDVKREFDEYMEKSQDQILRGLIYGE